MPFFVYFRIRSNWKLDVVAAVVMWPIAAAAVAGVWLVSIVDVDQDRFYDWIFVSDSVDGDDCETENL